MKEKEQYKRLLMFGTSLVILAVTVALWAFIWYRYYSDAIMLPFFRRGNWLVLAVYAVLLFVFTRLYGGYRVGFYKRGDVIYSACLSALFVNGITYLQVCLLGRRLMPVYPMFLLTVADLICIAIWACWGHRTYLKLYPPHKMLVVYGSGLAESLVSKMQTRPDKYEICEMVSIDDGLERVFERIDHYSAVIICDVKSGARNKILKYCFARSVRTYLTPKISDTIVRGADEIHLFDTPLLLCRNCGLSVEQRFLKRAFDLLVSGVALVVASPFMLVVAIAIKAYDHGPALYKQKRLTLNGKVFEVYKFRSMIVDAEKNGGARLSSKHDDRITPVGRFIRKVRLDELPQLLNILKGDMSIVGPRPERPEIASQYEETMPEFRFRLEVKAGLTGYAQVLGKYNTTPYDKLKLDLMYIERYSFLLDLKLILMTLKILFLPSSTEGIADGNRTAELRRAGELPHVAEASDKVGVE